MIAKKQMLKSIAYEYIKTKILHYDLPPGIDLSEKEFENQLNMSRTPVREAILQLAQEGYINIFPHKGIFVSQLSYEDMHELYKMRLFFEIPCIPYICEAVKIDSVRSHITELLNYFSSYEYSVDPVVIDEWTVKDRELHKIIINSYDNHQFSLLYDIIVNKIMRIRYLLARNIRSRTEDASSEHVRIITAILNKDLKVAKMELTKHIDVPICLQVVVEDVMRRKI